MQPIETVIGAQMKEISSNMEIVLAELIKINEALKAINDAWNK